MSHEIDQILQYSGTASDGLADQQAIDCQSSKGGQIAFAGIRKENFGVICPLSGHDGFDMSLSSAPLILTYHQTSTGYCVAVTGHESVHRQCLVDGFCCLTRDLIP